MPTSKFRRSAICLAALGAGPAIAHALVISNGYTAAIDDRFSSGYPTAPVANTSSSFLGAGLDFSGVGWNLADATQSAGLLSPRTLLEAIHYPMPTNAAGVTTPTIAFLPPSTTTPVTSYVQSATQLTSTADIDIEIGTLGAPLPASIQVYSILDQGPSGNYTNDPLLMYGKGGPSPRIGNNIIEGANSGSDGNELYFNLSGSQPNLATPETGDSQSPLFIPWTNPVSGLAELTIIGAQWQTAFSSFVADQTQIANIDAIMAPSGYALRWTPASIATIWQGGVSGNWATAANWSAGLPDTTAYIEFDPSLSASAASRMIVLTANETVSGVYFKSGPSGRPFTIEAGSILNLGRGGIVNYDSASQVINTNISFNDYQNWFAGTGGLNITGTLINNGYLLYLNTAGPSTLSGLLTGTGGLAKDGAGTLTIDSSQNFSGPVFAHAGTIVVAHPTGLSTSSISIDAGATVKYVQPSSQAASIGGLTMAAGAVLDVDSTLVFPTSTTTARDALFAQLKASVISGQAGGGWTGTGITSSLAQSQDAALGHEVYAVALVRNIDLQVRFNATTRPFDGVNVNNWALLMKYTYVGDTDLDGRITADDYLNIDYAYLHNSPATWNDGDFNYDGTINYLDYALMDNAYMHQSGTLADGVIEEHAAEFGQPYLDALNALGNPIPEPATLFTFVAGVSLLVTRRKRREVRLWRDQSFQRVRNLQ